MYYLMVLEPETEYNVSENEYDAVKNKHDKEYKYLLSVNWKDNKIRPPIVLKFIE